MLKLPEKKGDPKETEGLCKCRPVCKSRRRQWKGQLQKTSSELLIERKPKPDCVRRWRTKVVPNGPCPLFTRTRGPLIVERGAPKPQPAVVRLCQAPIDGTVHAPYLRLAHLAKKLGACQMVPAVCPFCFCGTCCCCSPREYILQQETEQNRRRAMRSYNTRVKDLCKVMRIMYDL